MRYRITYETGKDAIDLDITADATASVGDLADALIARDPRSTPGMTKSTLRMVTDRRKVDLQPDQSLVDSPLRSGCRVEAIATFVRPGAAQTQAILRIVKGPDAGKQFPLAAGTHTLGRNPEMDIQFADPLVSREHARIVVGTKVEIIDTNSANGVVIDGVPVTRAALRPGDRALVGDTYITVERPTRAEDAPALSQTAGDEGFIRSPRLRPRFEALELKAPDLPERPRAQRFPIVALLTPLLLGGALFAVSQSPLSLIFVAMTPIMMLGSWLEAKWSTGKQTKQDWAKFQADMTALTAQVRKEQEREKACRADENPSADRVVMAVRARDSLLWSRRPSELEFLQLRLGVADLASRVSVDEPYASMADPAMLDHLARLRQEHALVSAVPVVADLKTCGSVGVAGPADLRSALAASLVVQVAGMHSPSEVAIAACVGSRSSQRWDWLKWLPHTSSPYVPVDCEVLANSLTAGTELVGELEDLVASRTSRDKSSSEPRTTVVLLVEDDTTVEISRLVWLAEHGPAAGIHLLWFAPDTSGLPAPCRVFVDLGKNAPSAGFADDGLAVGRMVIDAVPPQVAVEVARALAPLTDAGARGNDDTNLPSSISYLALAGPPLAVDPSAVTDRWRENASINHLWETSHDRRNNGLRALLGQSPTEPLAIDLRSQGPHALVGGTTGSGKSELLQTWVLSLAAAYSPDRVTFLLVDYKGGSAFGECVALPHCVGLVTDLSPHLVRRALQSLEAELKYRERLLDAAKVKDLESMERLRIPQTPPSLILVVDEFAALVNDVPEFVDGVINVAQRGRSLGLHLILATQRPAGVIKDNLRANTNLRLALRMADEADSLDVLGTADAARFDPDVPGRVAIRNGPDRVTPFQAGYVGGHTDAEQKSAEIRVYELSFGVGREWEVPEVGGRLLPQPATTDLQRLVSTVTEAARKSGLQAPRLPWLPELPDTVAWPIPDAPAPSDGSIVFALGDRPEVQQQPAVAFSPDTDGNLAIIGTGGSGKSTALRTIAVAASQDPAGPSHIYCLDFGSRGLDMLSALPSVGAVIAQDDDERIVRLLRDVRRMLDERSALYAKARASNITEYRIRAQARLEPRIIVMVDGLAAFRKAHEVARPGNSYDLLASIAADGRAVGIHVVVTADRFGVLPSSLASLMPRRLVLRTADDNDLSLLGVPRDLFSLQSPPGRAFIDGLEIQVAVFGGDPSVAVQAGAIQSLAEQLESAAAYRAAPDVRRLPERIALSQLGSAGPDRIVIGLEDRDLQPASIPTSGTFTVTGPPGSGRTSAVRTIVSSFRRSVPRGKTVLLSANRSALQSAVDWHAYAAEVEGVQEAAAALQTDVAKAEPGTWLIVVENVGDLVNTSADSVLQDLVKAARRAGQLVVAEGDSQSMRAYSALLQAVRFSRRGIALQPDPSDGDVLLGSSFLRVKRADFPQGRGLLVMEGRVQRVQMAIVADSV